MEAETAEELPQPPGWAYEPKWDGFRVTVWSTSSDEAVAEPVDAAPDATGAAESLGPRLDSRNAKPLLRYFPELQPALLQLPPGTVADGEVIVVREGKLDFDALLNRIHPAKSRVMRLAAETPAQVALFDLLALEGEDLRRRPFVERRARLERLATKLHAGEEGSSWLLTPDTADLETARRWFHAFEPAGFDGIVAKALDRPYSEGRREMIKIKHRRTVDCVVGGFRVQASGDRVGSLLLGLYNAQGHLHFIGHCSSFGEREARDLLARLRPLEVVSVEVASDTPNPGGFDKQARFPGGESRWSRKERGAEEGGFVAVRPELVVEVTYDQLTGDRFRHATRLERWRPDKRPVDCTMDQLARPKGAAFAEALRAL
jgi:ATP-dependent DNA ligase